MAIEILTRYRFGRPPTEEEQAARVDVSVPVATYARVDSGVFAMNERFLEVCDGRYVNRGTGTAIFAGAGGASLAISIMLIWMIANASHYARQQSDVTFAHWMFGVLLIVVGGIFVLSLRALLADCFTYTYWSIRLDRLSRTIRVFRHNGKNGITTVPWDSAFFYIERKARGGIAMAQACSIRCHVLDENNNVIDSFSLGNPVHIISDSQSERGKQQTESLLAKLEFYRRYINEGPYDVPRVTEFLPKNVSFGNSLRFAFDGTKEVLASGKIFLFAFLAVAAVSNFLMAVCHYVTMKTCRVPGWTDEPEDAGGVGRQQDAQATSL